MKLKGINPLEQHAEKLALGTALAAFVGLFVMQFDILGDPNAIEVPGGDAKSPDQVGSVAIERAAKISADLNPRSLPDLPTEKNLSDEYLAALDEPVIDPAMSTLSLAGGWDATAISEQAGPDFFSTEAKAFAQARPPAPSKPLARQWGTTVDPLALGVHPELKDFVRDRQPYDLLATTIETTIVPADVLDAFRAIPESEELTRVPDSWLQVIQLLDVIVIREELVDGAWTNELTLDAVPGQHSFRDQINAESFDASQIDTLLAEERENRDAIRRAPVYPSIAGDCFLWPSLALRAKPDGAAIEKRDALLNEKRQRNRDIERWQRQLADMAWVIPANPWPAIPATALSQAGGGRDPGEENKGDKAQERRERIQGLIDAARERIREIDDELAELGFDPEGNSMLDPCSERLNPTLEDLNSGSANPITLWAHDLTAEPAKTYRYKARISVTNPFLGRAGMLNEEQGRLAERLAVTSIDSEWSDPIATLPEVAYFVVGATDGGEQAFVAPGAQAVGGGIIRPEATVRAFRFFYGYWRQGEADLRIGDRVEAEAPLPEVPLPIFEMVDGPDGLTWSGESEPIEEPIPLESEAYLVDVSTVLPTIGGNIQAAFSALVGGIELRSEDVDTTSSVFLALMESARTGQTAEIRNPGNGVTPDRGGAPRAPRPGVGGPRGDPPPERRGDDKPGGGKPRRPI